MKVILIQSLKGGTGKTEVCVGLGRALAANGHKVGFLDIDWIAPNLHIKLGIPPSQQISLNAGVGNVIQPVISPEGFPVISSSFIFPEDQAVSMDEESKIKDILEITSPGVVAWGDIEYLMVDTPPTTSQFMQVALKMPGMVGVVLVVQPAVSAMADLLRTVSLLKEKQVPIIGLIGNQVYVLCDNCKERVDLYELREKDIKSFCVQVGIPYLGSTPHILPTQGKVDLREIANKLERAQPVFLKNQEASSLPLKLIMAIANKRKAKQNQEVES
jgi:ATP-binding protein involved in chromosome partitioning